MSNNSKPTTSEAKAKPSQKDSQKDVEEVRQRGKTIRTVIIVIVVLIIVSSPLWLCGGCAAIGALLPTSHDTGVEETSSESTDTSDDSSAASQTYEVGESVEFGDYIMQVATFEDPYITSDEYDLPEAGNRYIAVDVVYNNPTSSPIAYNPYDWQLFDGDGYSYTYDWMGKDPMLSSGNLNAGATVRGWLTFEVPEDATNFKLQFAPDMLSSDNIEFQLD